MTASPTRMTVTALAGIPEIRPGDDLAALIIDAVADNGEAIADGDVVVVAQKIVSKAEGRYADLAEVTRAPNRSTILSCSSAKGTPTLPGLSVAP